MCKCDSVWILELWCHIDDVLRGFDLGSTKYDVTEGLGVKCTASIWNDSSFLTWCIKLLEVSLKRWCAVVNKGRTWAPKTLSWVLWFKLCSNGTDSLTLRLLADLEWSLRLLQLICSSVQHNVCLQSSENLDWNKWFLRKQALASYFLSTLCKP